jgi:glycosyltransferase involved in cell wall biosynthesis
MKICHVAPELLPVPPTRGGAIERWIRDAAGRLVQRGHEVHVIARDHGDGRLRDSIDGVHYHFVQIPDGLDQGLAAVMLRGLWHYEGVRRRLAAIQPDIVHHHSRPSGLWLSKGGAPRARAVISLHSMDYGWAFGYSRWDRHLFTRGFAAASRVLCVSNFIRTHTETRYPQVAGKTATVYNGVDGEVFRPSGSVGDGEHTILFVGRVEERKGVHVLLDAFEGEISRRLPNARLRIVGPHSYWHNQPSPYYQALVTRCRQNPRIELRGPTYVDAELATVYREAAVSVVPSVFPEALGLTALEAQASGTPIVVSDAGGLPETVAAEESGLVFANGDVDQLANAVIRVMADPERRRRMGEAASQWAMKMFSWDVIAAQLEEQYAAALRQPAGAAA